MVIVEETVAHLDLEGGFCVETHEDEKEESKAKEASNRREQVLNFSEGALAEYVIGRFPQVNIQVLIGKVQGVFDLCKRIHAQNGHIINIAPREETIVS